MLQNKNSVIMTLDVELKVWGENGQPETIKYHGATEYILNEYGYYTHLRKVGDNPRIGDIFRQITEHKQLRLGEPSTLSVTRSPKIIKPGPWGGETLFEVYFFHGANDFAIQVNNALRENSVPKPASSCEGMLYGYASNAYTALRTKALSAYNWATGTEPTSSEKADTSLSERAKIMA